MATETLDIQFLQKKMTFKATWAAREGDPPRCELVFQGTHEELPPLTNDDVGAIRRLLQDRIDAFVRACSYAFTYILVDKDIRNALQKKE